MTEFSFTCSEHRKWIDENPHQAFKCVLNTSKLAEEKLQRDQFHEAIPLLGLAFETAKIIFDKRLESPQLTTSLTSWAIMLAHAYSAVGESVKASKLLTSLQNTLQCAIHCAIGYETKVAFFQHCAEAITEANLDIKIPHQSYKAISHYH